MHKTDHCVYELLDNDIHYFKWLTSRRQTVEDYYTIATPIALNSDKTLLFVIDFAAENLPPLKYMTQRSSQFYADNPGISDRLYIAYLHENYQIKMAEVLLNAMRNSTTRRFFNRSEYNDAVDWLLNR